MISHTTADFRRDFANLPPLLRKQAREAYRLFLSDPKHPGLKFKKLPPHEDLWSVRISADYRAMGRWRGETIV
jgi:hypothetical protein